MRRKRDRRTLILPEAARIKSPWSAPASGVAVGALAARFLPLPFKLYKSPPGAGATLAAGVSEIGADVIEKKIENYTEEKDALKQFNDRLAKVAAKVREEQDFPLTIIMDELDRCRPSFALALLERIKHLFDVDTAEPHTKGGHADRATAFALSHLRAHF